MFLPRYVGSGNNASREKSYGAADPDHFVTPGDDSDALAVISRQAVTRRFASGGQSRPPTGGHPPARHRGPGDSGSPRLTPVTHRPEARARTSEDQGYRSRRLTSAQVRAGSRGSRGPGVQRLTGIRRRVRRHGRLRRQPAVLTSQPAVAGRPPSRARVPPRAEAGPDTGPRRSGSAAGDDGGRRSGYRSQRRRGPGEDTGRRRRPRRRDGHLVGANRGRGPGPDGPTVPAGDSGRTVTDRQHPPGAVAAAGGPDMENNPTPRRNRWRLPPGAPRGEADDAGRMYPCYSPPVEWNNASLCRCGPD